MKNVLKLIIPFVILVLSCVFNFNTNIVNMLFNVLLDCTMLYAFILLGKKPVATVSLMVLRQIILIGYDMSRGVSFSVSLGSYWIELALCMIALIVFVNIINVDGDKIKERVKNLINYNRDCIKIPLWAHLCIVCITIVTINFLSKSDILSTINKDVSLRVLAAMIILMPTFELISILTTTNVAYTMIIFHHLAKIYTAINLYVIDKLTFQDGLKIITDTIVIIGVLLWRIKNKHERLKNN